MSKRLGMIAVLTAILVSGAASAEVLWDQSDYDMGVPGFFNSESGSPPFGLTHYAVSDVIVDGGGWYVTKISAYFGAADLDWGAGISEGKVHVFSKTGALPTNGVDDPVASPTVAMSATLMGDVFVVTASDLDLQLDPGEYWIGITPVAPSGFFGPEPHWAAMTYIGDATASLDPYAFPGPPGWFNFNPGVDAAILVEGVVFPPCGGDDEDEDEDEDEDSDDGTVHGDLGETTINDGSLIHLSAGDSNESNNKTTDADNLRTDDRRSVKRDDRRTR